MGFHVDLVVARPAPWAPKVPLPVAGRVSFSVAGREPKRVVDEVLPDMRRREGGRAASEGGCNEEARMEG